jgi:segregation and condensation protein B
MTKNNFEQLEIQEASTKNIYFSIIESLLFASGDPLKSKEIAAIIGISLEETEILMNGLAEEYGKRERGIKVIKFNNEYQLVTKSENSAYLQKLLNTNVRQSLSQASLETLAIIAYKQPITRIEIDEIRGVKSDSAVATLLEKKLIKETGRKDVIGRPILYGTTNEFLKHFDLSSLNEMPVLEVLNTGSEEETVE